MSGTVSAGERIVQKPIMMAIIILLSVASMAGEARGSAGDSRASHVASSSPHGRDVMMALLCPGDIAPVSGPSIVTCLSAEGALIQFIGSQCPRPLAPAVMPKCSRPLR
jgi:hypothetical protein